jgi:hypothetical protein
VPLGDGLDLVTVDGLAGQMRIAVVRRDVELPLLERLLLGAVERPSPLITLLVGVVAPTVTSCSYCVWSNPFGASALSPVHGNPQAGTSAIRRTTRTSCGKSPPPEASRFPSRIPVANGF